jgi:hypothetical protein
MLQADVSSRLHSLWRMYTSNWKFLPAKAQFQKNKINLQHCNFMIINFVQFRMLIL